MNKGRVTKSAGDIFSVQPEEGKPLECKLAGRYRLEDLRTTNPVVVGDWVAYESAPNAQFGRILEVLPRKNYIIRKSAKLSKSHQIIATNIDQLLLMVTVIKPVTHPEFIDRYLVSAEAYNIPAFLLINKTDLYGEKELATLEEWKQIYTPIGYACHTCRADDEETLGEIVELMREKVSLIGGISGVGKSTLINTLEPGLKLKTREISDAHRAGKHTTTFAEMFPLHSGGYVIDTPGIRGFGLTDMENEPLFHYFPEFFNVSKDCRFHNCIHVNEPDCAVIQGLESGHLSLSRYRSYLNLLEEQQNAQKYR